MKKIILTFLMTVLFVPSVAFAEGFGLYDWSAAGNAMSHNYMFGEDDPSVLAYNPAQITKIRGSYLQAGFTFINPSISLDFHGSYSDGTHTTTNYNPATVPSLFYVQDTRGGGVWWGVGVFARFGNAMELDKNGWGRYDTIFAGVKSITVQPTVAFKPHKKWSLAFGLDLNYGGLKNKKAIPPVSLGGDESFLQVEGDSINVGYLISAMYDFDDETSAALMYRSRIHHSVNEADFVAEGGVPHFAKAETAVTLPDSLTFGIGHKFNDKTRVEANVTWTHWSLYDKLNITLDKPWISPTLSIENNWNSSWKLGVGIEHKLNKEWTLLAGYTWDQSPFPSKYVNLSLPTGNRHYLSAGCKYSPNDVMTLALAYCYVIMGDRLVQSHELRPGITNPLYDTVNAHNEYSHNVSLSLTVKCR